MKRALISGAAIVMLAGAAAAGTPQLTPPGAGNAGSLDRCTVRVSASGLTVGNEYSFVLTANSNDETFTYQVQVKADDASFEGRNFNVEIAPGTTMALSGKNLTDPAAPELIGAVNETCHDRQPSAIRAPRG